jgi:hypothetical protein
VEVEDTGGTHLGLVVHLVEVLVTALELVVLLLLVQAVRHHKVIMVVMVLLMLEAQEQRPLVVVEVAHLSEAMLLEAQVEQVEQEHQIVLLALRSFTLVAAVVVEHLLEG